MPTRIDDAVPDAHAARAIRALAREVATADGAPPLSDRALGRLGSADVRHLVAVDDTGVVAYAQLATADADAEVGWELELTGRTGALAPTLDAALADAGGPVLVWSHGTDSRLADVFAGRGYARARELFQYRRPSDVPLPDDPPLADGVTVRRFEPGRDEQAWLAVNAAAFAHHPEQGDMTLADLTEREHEDWFDADGFLLAERGTGDAAELLGFHWTKIHPDGAGEVYVLGISPAAQGQHLGDALLLRGLRHLQLKDCPYVLLYVDGDNPGAIRLYERQLFTRHDVDIQWRTG